MHDILSPYRIRKSCAHDGCDRCWADGSVCPAKNTRTGRKHMPARLIGWQRAAASQHDTRKNNSLHVAPRKELSPLHIVPMDYDERTTWRPRDASSRCRIGSRCLQRVAFGSPEQDASWKFSLDFFSLLLSLDNAGPSPRMYTANVTPPDGRAKQERADGRATEQLMRPAMVVCCCCALAQRRS
jgi:hypothetical protein